MVKELTLSMIDEYIEATGQGVARRATLTPEEYILFRTQAIKELNQTPVADIQTMVQTPMPKADTHMKSSIPVTNSEPKPSQSIESVSTKVHTDTFSSLEEDDDDDMLSLLKSIPG